MRRKRRSVPNLCSSKKNGALRNGVEKRFAKKGRGTSAVQKRE
jgi:hypothetical protein